MVIEEKIIRMENAVRRPDWRLGSMRSRGQSSKVGEDSTRTWGRLRKNRTLPTKGDCWTKLATLSRIKKE